MGALRIPASDLVAWADDMGATHFITLTAGCYPERAFDPDVSFRPDLARLARRIGRELCGLPRRKDPTPGNLPAFAAFYEPTTGSGTPYPHIHGWISLTGNEEEHLRAILRTYWGSGRQTGDHLTLPPTLSVHSPRSEGRLSKPYMGTDIRPAAHPIQRRGDLQRQGLHSNRNYLRLGNDPQPHLTANDKRPHDTTTTSRQHNTIKRIDLRR